MEIKIFSSLPDNCKIFTSCNTLKIITNLYWMVFFFKPGLCVCVCICVLCAHTYTSEWHSAEITHCKTMIGLPAGFISVQMGIGFFVVFHSGSASIRLVFAFFAHLYSLDGTIPVNPRATQLPIRNYSEVMKCFARNRAQ